MRGDLVQMECLAGSRGVVRVTSGDRVGHLYFRGGAVVYALIESATGEGAALEMPHVERGHLPVGGARVAGPRQHLVQLAGARHPGGARA